MMDVTREMIAYAIMGAAAMAALVVGRSVLRRRHYEKLRRRGIKRHGH